MPPRRKRLFEEGVPHLVVDILETHYGQWMTEAMIVDAVRLIRPDAKPETVHRAVQRLHSRPSVAITRTYDIAIEVRRSEDNNQPRTEFRVATRAYWQEATG